MTPNLRHFHIRIRIGLLILFITALSFSSCQRLLSELLSVQELLTQQPTDQPPTALQPAVPQPADQPPPAARQPGTQQPPAIRQPSAQSSADQQPTAQPPSAVQLPPARGDFESLSGVVPSGITSDGTTMWVSDITSGSPKVFAYNLRSKTRDAAKDVILLGANNNPQGLWTDGTTIWVVDGTWGTIYAYNLRTGARDWGKSIYIARRSPGITSVWSDGATMWVMLVSRGIVAYNLISGERDMTKEFATLPTDGIVNGAGIWSDGTTMWVVDQSDKKLYAYNLSTRERDQAKDFNDLDRSLPSYIWSDGATLWLSDTVERKIYAYNLETRKRDSSSTSVPAIPGPPGIPGNLRVTAGNKKVTLSWDEAANAAFYRILRSGPFQPQRVFIATVSSPGLTYTDTGFANAQIFLVNGRTYTYTVRAVNAAGVMSYGSDPITATPTR